MRFLVGVLALLACGVGPTAPRSGQLSIVLDPQSCTARVGQFEAFVDGVSQGWVSASPGGAWRMSIAPGQHTTSARVLGTALTWAPETITVPDGGEATRVLHC